MPGAEGAVLQLLEALTRASFEKEPSDLWKAVCLLSCVCGFLRRFVMVKPGVA